MRRYCACLLAISLLALPLAGCQTAAQTGVTGLSTEGADSFTLKGDPAYTREVTVEDAEQVAGLVALLAAAAPVAEPPPGLTESGTIALQGPSDLDAYPLMTDGSGFYLKAEEDILALDGEALAAFLSPLEDSLYLYREIPALIGPEQAIPPYETGYEYLGLDGKFHPAAHKYGGDGPGLDWDGETLPLLEFAREPAAAQVTVLLEGAPVFTGGLEEAALFRLLGDREYTMEIDAEYRTGYYRGEARYRYVVRTEPREIAFALVGEITDPGEVVVLLVENLSPDEEVIFESDIPYTPAFFPLGEDRRMALLPVSYYVSPGQHYIQLSVSGYRQASRRFDMTVNSKQFPVQNLTISEETAEETIYSQEANDEYNRVIPPLRSVMDDVMHWEGRFLRPVEGGEISTPFGVIRYTNGSSSASRHGALDIALPTGTPVSAPNHGRVLFAGELKLTGNTILIEHGFGLKTWYYHMDSLAVTTGEMVTQGQNLGAVGSTGFSTGPHLHYGMSVNGVFINPDTAELTDLLIIGGGAGEQ